MGPTVPNSSERFPSQILSADVEERRKLLAPPAATAPIFGCPEAVVTLTVGASQLVGLLLGGLSGISMASTDKFNSPSIL